MSSNPRVRTSSIEDLLTRVLDRGYGSIATRVLRAIGGSVTSGQVARDLAALDEEAARLAEAGERLHPDNAHIRAVLQSLDLAMRDNVVRLRDASGELQLVGVSAAEVLTRQLALPGLEDNQLDAIGIQWNSPSVDTILQVVELVDNPAFNDALAGFTDEVINTVANQVLRGITFGWSPLRTARELRRIAEGLPIAASNTLMRTLQLESYRSATAAYQTANQSIIRRVIRMETLDDRICMACIALHGTVVWDAEVNEGQPIPKISEHRNGRGTTVSETVIRPLTLQTGADWWVNQSEATQRRLAGSAAYNALSANAVRLEDFVGEVTDPLFDAMIFERSLVSILGSGASQYYQRNQNPS